MILGQIMENELLHKLYLEQALAIKSLTPFSDFYCVLVKLADNSWIFSRNFFGVPSLAIFEFSESESFIEKITGFHFKASWVVHFSVTLNMREKVKRFKAKIHKNLSRYPIYVKFLRKRDKVAGYILIRLLAFLNVIRPFLIFCVKTPNPDKKS